MKAVDQIRAELIRAARDIGAPAAVDPLLERPRDSSHGDWASNLAMVLAKPLRSKPRDIAERLRSTMKLDAAGVSRVDIARPRVKDFWIDPGQNRPRPGDILRSDDKYRHNGKGCGPCLQRQVRSSDST